MFVTKRRYDKDILQLKESILHLNSKIMVALDKPEALRLAQEAIDLRAVECSDITQIVCEAEHGHVTVQFPLGTTGLTETYSLKRLRNLINESKAEAFDKLTKERNVL